MSEDQFEKDVERALRQGEDPRELLLAGALRGYQAMGLVPRDDAGLGLWERLTLTDQQRWLRLARLVLASTDRIDRESRERVDTERGEGFYWMRFTSPVIENGGLADEVWGEPTVGYYDGLRWYPCWKEIAVADQFEVEVMSSRLEAPTRAKPPETVEPTRVESVAERVVAAVGQQLDGTLRRELLGRLEAVVRSWESGPETPRLRGEKYDGPDVAVQWRGSVRDLVTDIKALLSVDELQELAAEAALAWREKRTGQAFDPEKETP